MTEETQEALWVTEAEVAEVMDLRGALAALREGLALEHRGAATSLEKTHAIWGDGHTLHALGATYEGCGLVGAKTWAHTAGGATPLLALWGSDDGRLVAIVEAFGLGQLRTSGLSGVATQTLARDDAARFALVGAGAQALAQAAAVVAVRPITQIVVFSRDRSKAEKTALRIREHVDAEVRSTDSVADAITDADIVTAVTRAREPILSRDALAGGVHVNAVGAITPERRELATDVVAGAKLIACDEVSSARRLSNDLRAVFGDDPDAWRHVRPLSEIAMNPPSRGSEDLTLYKGMGTGLADVAVGAAVVRAARAQGLGRPVRQPVRVPPRLFEGVVREERDT